jgi:hypothetical protein
MDLHPTNFILDIAKGWRSSLTWLRAGQTSGVELLGSCGNLLL